MSDFETVPVGTMEELKKVKAERDALAVHLEAAQRLADKDRVNEALFTAHYEKPDPDTLGWKSKLGRDLHQVLKGAPAIFLTRFKAEWQAEVLEERANWAMCRTDERKLLKAAAELRRQAEEWAAQWQLK